MATLTRKNWTLNSYTVDTWTDLVGEPAILAAVVVANTGSTDALVSIRLSDGAGASLAVILPDFTLAPGESETLSLRSINVVGTQVLQVKADVAGVDVLASGASD